MKTEITNSMLSAALREVIKADRLFAAYDKKGRSHDETREAYQARWELLRHRWHQADVACEALQRARYAQSEMGRQRVSTLNA